MKKEYIVGVDFGYDVTSAWIVSLFDDNLYGESLKLNATNRESEKSYYSIIYYNPKYGYSLDDLSGNIIAGFKDKVSVLDQPQNAKKREAYTEYIKQIYARLLKYNTVLKVDKNGDANFYLCIAFPSKWNQEDKDAYIKFFNNALCEFGIEVMLGINDSDAIYNSFLPQRSNKNSLLINYNAGYIEYIVRNNERKKYIKVSSLGLDRVIEILLDECRKDVDFQKTLGYTHSKLSELNIDAIDVMSNIKHEIKKGVEYSVTYGYYPNLNVYYNLIEQQTSYGFTDTFRAEKRKYKFEIDCQIDKYIESYKEMLENEFNSIDSDNKIDNVIITGHYSSMPWITEVVEKVFNTATIHIDHQGGFAIARGIALFAKQQMKASKTLIHI